MDRRRRWLRQGGTSLSGWVGRGLPRPRLRRRRRPRRRRVQHPRLGWAGLPAPDSTLTGSSLGQSGMTLMPIPMMTTTPGTATSAASTRAADPLGLGFVYGPAAIPMTPGQAGLFMLSAGSRMTGLGNGQLSGVRPGGQPDSQAARKRQVKADALATAAHTRNANIPGGPGRALLQPGTTPAPAAGRSLTTSGTSVISRRRDNNEIPPAFDLSERGIVPILCRVKTDLAETGRTLGEEASRTRNRIASGGELNRP